MNEQPRDDSSSPTPSSSQRQGNPLDGLWHWTDHPAVRFGMVLVGLAVILLLFPVLAQWTF